MYFSHFEGTESLKRYLVSPSDFCFQIVLESMSVDFSNKIILSPDPAEISEGPKVD